MISYFLYNFIPIQYKLQENIPEIIKKLANISSNNNYHLKREDLNIILGSLFSVSKSKQLDQDKRIELIKYLKSNILHGDYLNVENLAITNGLFYDFDLSLFVFGNQSFILERLQIIRSKITPRTTFCDFTMSLSEINYGTNQGPMYIGFEDLQSREIMNFKNKRTMVIKEFKENNYVNIIPSVQELNAINPKGLHSVYNFRTEKICKMGLKKYVNFYEEENYKRNEDYGNIEIDITNSESASKLPEPEFIKKIGLRYENSEIIRHSKCFMGLGSEYNGLPWRVNEGNKTRLWQVFNGEFTVYLAQNSNDNMKAFNTLKSKNKFNELNRELVNVIEFTVKIRESILGVSQ